MIMENEEKAKAYDEALKVAVAAHKDEDKHLKATLERIFPELAEHEDKRIREKLIDTFNFYDPVMNSPFLLGIHKKDILAWLEKQGKQIPADKVESKDYSSIDPHFGKPIDKQKPKFHEGNWVILFEHNDSIYQVERIDNYRYYLRHYSGYTISPHFDRETIRLWTIKDAKDGDVLYSPCCKLLWIYKDDNSCYVGHNLNYSENCVVVNSPICIPSDVCPATKEQRDTLFAKMKEAGYDWDADKKELKRIEDENYDGEDYGIDSLFHAQRILEKTLGKVNGYQTDDGILAHKCAITAVNKIYKQKSAWSEDDEEKFRDVIRLIEQGAPVQSQRDHYTNWLKSLKERIGG